VDEPPAWGGVGVDRVRPGTVRSRPGPAAGSAFRTTVRAARPAVRAGRTAARNRACPIVSPCWPFSPDL